MVVRDIAEAKSELAALIEAAQSGNEVIITDAGRPVAKIAPYHSEMQPRSPGSMKGEIWMADDFDTLPDDVATALGMKEPID